MILTQGRFGEHGLWAVADFEFSARLVLLRNAVMLSTVQDNLKKLREGMRKYFDESVKSIINLRA